jgi:hypothetical protein
MKPMFDIEGSPRAVFKKGAPACHGPAGRARRQNRGATQPTDPAMTKTTTTLSDFGLIGLAVMGQNLVLNVESRGFQVSVYNRTGAVTDEFVARHPGKQLVGAATLEQFVASLAKPRKVMIMVKAGAPVDAVIDQLKPLLSK